MKLVLSLLIAIFLALATISPVNAYGGGGNPGFPPPSKVKLVCTFIPYTLPSGNVIQIPKCKLVKVNHPSGHHKDFSDRLSDFFDRFVNGHS